MKIFNVEKFIARCYRLLLHYLGILNVISITTYLKKLLRFSNFLFHPGIEKSNVALQNWYFMKQERLHHEKQQKILISYNHKNCKIWTQTRPCRTQPKAHKVTDVYFITADYLCIQILYNYFTTYNFYDCNVTLSDHTEINASLQSNNMLNYLPDNILVPENATWFKRR